MNRLSKSARISTLALISALACAPAYAQDAAEDETATPDIVVTAQFREQRLQDTPIAITAVNAEMLEARGQTDITQVAAQAPNVTLRPQPQNGGSGLIAFIRGVGQTDFNYALDPGVGLYIDDVYIPTLSSSLLELIDLERIEILRGPQGTLAGKNAIGGAIKLFSTKPKGDNTGSVQVGYGSYNALNIRGVADFKISEQLAVRVSGMARSSDGYVAMLDYGLTHPTSNVPANNARGRGNADYSTMGGQNITAIRGALRWTPGSTIEVNLSGDYTRENSDAIPVVLIAAGAPSGAFDPASVGNSASFNPLTGVTTPWLVGKNGAQVNNSCAFVPAGPYSCDTGGNLLGWDPRFVSYSNFMDAVAPTTQAPFKPYFALPVTKFTGWGVHGSVSFDLSDNLNLQYIGSYRAYNSKFGQDQDGTPIPISQLDNELNHHAFSSEVRLNFKAGDGLVEGTVGAYYLDQEGTYTARVDLNYVSPVIDFIHGPDNTPSTTKAVFGTATLRPIEGMSLTGGLRYTKDKKDYTYFRSNPDGTLPNGFNCFVLSPAPFNEPNCLLAGLFDITGSFKGSQLDWRVVGDYRFSRDFLAYASVSTGFKGGGVNPRPFVADQRLSFSPETLTTFEVGFKADLLDRRVRLNGAAFLNKYKDIVLTKLVCPESSLPFPCLRPANIGAADVKGFELEATIRPAEGFTLDGSFSYLDFEYTSPTEGTPPVLVGSAIPASAITPFTPKTTYSIGAQYDYEMGPGTVSLRFDGSYQSKMYTTSENSIWSKMPGRFIANGQLSFTSEDKNWKLTAEVKNIFDKYYFLSVSDATTGLGVVTGVPALPRTWQLSVKRNF